MFDSIFTTTVETSITLSGLLLALAVSLALGLLIALVYMKTHKAGSPSASFSVTLVMLPAVVAVIILLVGSNVARAFSLAGAFAIIRFRSAPGDPKDITCVLFSMAVGLAAGMGFLLYAAIVAFILCAAMLALDALHFGQSRNPPRQLKMTVPEDLNFEGAFDEVLAHYTESAQLNRMKTADLGSLYELTYAVVPKAGISEKAFIDALRCLNGNMNITLTVVPPSSEF